MFKKMQYFTNIDIGALSYEHDQSQMILKFDQNYIK
jgi:hypothetical protein